MKKIVDLFLNERLMLVIIVLNAAILFLQECGVTMAWLSMLDVTCTFMFIVEMILKHHQLGLKGYWKDGWNRLDGILVILSLPSVVTLFVPHDALDMSFLLVLRIFRVFRFFRLVHAFPKFTQIMKNFGLALRQSYAVMIGLVIMIIVFAMVSCSLFRDAVPEYFSTPLNGIYTTFRIFTGEGWNEIPDMVATNVGPGWGHAVRIYFCAILILGSIIGMSLLNSIFVDAMVSDNNDDVEHRLDILEQKIDKLLALKEKQELNKE